MSGPAAATVADRTRSRALFGAGFFAFALLYVPQGTLTDLSARFAVSPATASLAMSLTTLPLAVGVLAAATASERLGRRPFLLAALFGGAALTLLAAASPSFPVLVAARMATGLALAGLPAVAMAYVAEELPAEHLGRAMGLYISGTGLGGMTGRVCGALLSGVGSWRLALAVVGAGSLVGAVLVARRLPASHHFVAQHGGVARQLAGLGDHLRDPVLRRLFITGFLLMGSLVAFFNYLQYRLVAPPYHLSRIAVAGVFVLYVTGTVSANWMGRLTGRRPHRTVVLFGLALMATGLVATLAGALGVVLLGTAVITFGFFGAHAVASGWVSGHARARRAQSSALYLFFYHVGSSLAGYLGGLAYGGLGWAGLTGMIAGMLAVAVVLVSRLPARARPSGPEWADAA